MRVLLSAFACSPEEGSEPGVAWCWATELAPAHDLVVLTHEYFRAAIERALVRSPRANLRFVYYQPGWLKPGDLRSLNSRIYYAQWQLGALGVARALHREQRFDLVHHITWGTFRFPSFLGYVGAPFFFGPAGGGERAPWRLTLALPFKHRVRELVRELVVVSGKYDPLVWASLLRAQLIFTKTAETRAALPFWARRRALVRHEIGTFPVQLPARQTAPGRFKVLFAGNLIGLKGVHLGLRAFAALIAAGREAEFHIAGKGDLRGQLETLAQQLGVASSVTFLGYLPRAEMMARYAHMDCFLFPSLHDSSGNVVLEAIANGVPVVCLNLGGPPEFVDQSCGRVVPARGRSEAEVVAGLAEALRELHDDVELRQRLRQGALARAQTLTWAAQVGRTYDAIRAALRPAP